MAHDELGATIGDKVRIVENQGPMSARKRWRVIEIVQKGSEIRIADCQFPIGDWKTDDALRK